MKSTVGVLSAASIALLMLGTGAVAQQDFVNQDRLGEQAAALDSLSSEILDSVAGAMTTMDNFLNYSDADRTEQAIKILDMMEENTRSVVATVAFTSPFMTSLEQTRAELVTMLRKQSRNPPSPTRDAWLASLTRSLEIIDAETEKMRQAEEGLIRRLSNLNTMRADIRLNGKIQAAERFVEDLRVITSELEEMAALLDDVSSTVAIVPTTQTLSIE